MSVRNLQRPHHTTVVVICGILVLLFLGILTLFPARRSSGDGTCEFVLQLADPNVRNSYRQSLADAKMRTGDGSLFVTVTSDSGGVTTIDKFSADCISCHDGIMASHYDVTFRENVIRPANVRASHPIGQDYERFHGEDFKDILSLPAQIVLVGGKVGCLSCHDPLNPQLFHLAMDNSYSRLCLACHNR